MKSTRLLILLLLWEVLLMGFPLDVTAQDEYEDLLEFVCS